MSCGCNFRVETKPLKKNLEKCKEENSSIKLYNLIEEFNPYKHYVKNSVIAFEDNIYLAISEVYPSINTNCCNTSNTIEYPDLSNKWVKLLTSETLNNALTEFKDSIETVKDFSATVDDNNHTIKLETSNKSYSVEIPVNKADAKVTGNSLEITKPNGDKVNFYNNTYEAGTHLRKHSENIFEVTPNTLVDNTTTYVQNGKILAKQYDDTNVKNRLTNLESKTDKFINDATVSRKGNVVTFKYTYSDGSPAIEESFTDNDTIVTEYNDTELRNKIARLENRTNPSDIVAEFDPNTHHIVFIDRTKPEKPNQVVFDNISGRTSPVTGGELLFSVDLYNIVSTQAFVNWWKQSKEEIHGEVEEIYLKKVDYKPSTNSGTGSVEKDTFVDAFDQPVEGVE